MGQADNRRGTAGVSRAAPQSEAAILPGSDLAGYRVLKEIGQGAASRIYAVQDTKTKQVWVLKRVVKESEKDQRFLDQTETEYEVGSKIQHQSIRHVERLIKNRKLLRVSEIMLLMELVDGIPLERKVPESLEVLADIFQQVAEGLLHMHIEGYVHADMKPNNVIVTDERRAKVIDLGQSCRIGTVKERIQGTPDYIAPEQAHRRQITGATDVYNLGATMYWCLTGKHIPTAISDRTALGVAKDDHQIQRPTPPVELVPHVPLSWSDLVMHCVEPEPESRPSMESVRNKLQVIHLKLQTEAAGGAVKLAEKAASK